MEVLIKLNSSRIGHDKLMRTAVYACRLIGSSGDKVRNLEANLSAARKLLRLGTCVEALYSSLKTVSHPDMVIRVTSTLSRLFIIFGPCARWLSFIVPSSCFNKTEPLTRQLCLQILHARISAAMFLFCDHVLLLHHNHLLQINTGKWSRLSIQCWLYSIVMNLVRDVYTLRDVLATYGRTQGQHRVSSIINNSF